MPPLFSVRPCPLLPERDGTVTRFDFPPLAHVQEPMIAAVTRHFLGLAPNPAPTHEGVQVMEWMEALSTSGARQV
ncbi:hypothetical protein [Flaviaesturariibacter amylovorans]|uniref:Uncharacterized protein n=1 Tax=Flaviaesturariibacter amylovorans TaxID=1084520 RepID=A0ABP8HV39_9BACT